MVVSKESKRKRKDSPLPPQSSTVVAVELECSPEMPRRTKVQAQRKFAQGQTAPTTFSSQNVTSTSTSAGPSTSNESRERPTEILPNKRPKTEDFLTFLCFRGTSALPAHLDFFDQGKSRETEITQKKSIAKQTTKTTKKGGKRGRPKASNKTNIESKEETAIATGTKRAKNDSDASGVATSETVIEDNKSVNTNTTNNKDAAVMTFAVRKRAEIIAEGNRRGRSSDKCNNSIDIKRRSNRTAAREMRSLLETETDDDDDGYFLNHVVDEKLNNTDKKATTLTNNDVQNLKDGAEVGPKSETPIKEIESSKSRKGRACAAKKGKENSVDALENVRIPKTEEKPGKEKAPVKRPRQKESPIFIPSPEPSGRMTRQRAFFEPVKVPRLDEKDEKTNLETSEEKITAKETIQQKYDSKGNTTEKNDLKGRKGYTTPKVEILNETKSEVDSKNKSSLNIFDFSSDDEQPLAKAIKTKKENTSPKKANHRNAKETNKNSQKAAEILEEIAETNTEIVTVNQDAFQEEKSPTITTRTTVSKATNLDIEKKIKGKRGKAKKDTEQNNLSAEENISSTLTQSPIQSPQSISPRKTTNSSRQTKKKTASSNNDGEAMPNTRNQRPSRKTKEAAAIYMGIIGHKLQLADDEDDDLSLNSFPDLPNVKEMEKMELEIKKNANQPIINEGETISLSPKRQKSIPKQATTPTPQKAAPTHSSADKPSGGRRGRPPKQNKQQKQQQQLPPKREIEGMLVKKGAIAKLTANASISTATTTESTTITAAKLAEFNSQIKCAGKFPTNKLDSYEDEDFLLNEEVNETKRKLEKSFSDSDDEPLAIKASTKPSEKVSQLNIQKNAITTINSTPPLTILPLTTKTILTSPPIANAQRNTNLSPVGNMGIQTTPSPFKTIEKKSPVPTSKILNVPATYAIPSTNLPALASFKTTSYLPQASVHYQAPHLRPATTHQFPPAKLPSAPPPLAQLLSAPALPALSPLKYQSPTATTYPPPIEAYPSPKINPNFLTPKFDRANMPRPNNFPAPSPVKFDLSSSTNKTSLILNTTLSPKTPTGGMAAVPSFVNTSTAASNSNDPLKDEIGSILAANLMPSKEESGKIFGIASVSLAQSSGPDNTKCTLGKCGSIHKPVLGPSVPTEIYIGDQLSGKERRKAKVNMSHEQIQKWLMECSSNPDAIHDDLDDEYDDNLRPNLNSITPPPRDDKESTTLSSSSKATRDLGKSESAWSAKGPSLKATPVVSSANRRDDIKQADATPLSHEPSAATKVFGGHALNLTHKTNQRQTSNVNATIAYNVNRNNSSNADVKPIKEKVEKKTDKRTAKDDKTTAKELSNKDKKANKIEKDKEISTPSPKTNIDSKQMKNIAGQTSATQSQPPAQIVSPVKQTKRGKMVSSTQPAINDAEENKLNVMKNDEKSTATTPPGKTSKRTPVYSLKTAKAVELKETTTTSHKKSAPFSYGAFSADNEKSVYSFDRDDDDHADNTKKVSSKTAFRRQSGRESHSDEKSNATAPTTTETPPSKKRAAAAAAEKANKEIANASQNSSVSLTLSPTEKSKLVKVSLDADKVPTSKPAVSNRTAKNAKKSEINNAKKNESAEEEEESHTFYIPLQSSGSGADGEGGIQGVAVKLGREGPDGPNQKVIMHATLVTKAQMAPNTKPLPDTMNVSDIIKNLVTPINATTTSVADKNVNTPTTSAAAGIAIASATTNSASNSLKNVPIGTVQPRFKVNESSAGIAAATNSNSTSAGRLVRVNSNSSLFSGSAKSRVNHTAGAASSTATHLQNKKFKDDTPIKMSNNTAFPRHDDPTQMVEAPVFRPTEKEFADPIEFIERITPIAARFGICKIIPPANFKPECRISDEMRFTAYNQYVHKMLHRWGPSAKEMSAIKKYLATQSIVMNHPPWIGGMEVDLPRLYHTVQELGGLKEVIEKKKWARVAEEMCIPKLAQDRVTKLDDIYCKYLLPYDTLSPAERQKLFDEVEADWAKREARARRNADRFINTESVSNEEDEVSSDDDEESEEEVDGVSMECIVKGRSMPLSQFYRIARNTMALWFKNTEPTVNEVEAEFWRHVAVRDSHVCVHSGSIDSSGWGYGFPSPGPKGKGSNYARHPWNLKVLTNNPGSVLRSLGPVMGVTVPTLHVGMLFSACCWYRDPHGLSWIEYLHTGASKLWYGIPDDQSANFRAALTSLIPTHCQNKTIWLPCDTVMVPPHMLTDRSVSLCRIEQKPGEFIVVFPRAYTSSLATGYVVSESVYFATTTWLDLAKDDFRDIHDSCEPAMFSLEQLLFALGYDQRVTIDTLQQMLPMLNEVIDKETAAREQLKAAGVLASEKLQCVKSTKTKKPQQPPFRAIESECDLCRANLYISLIRTEDDNIYCLQHALKNLNNGNIQAKNCKLIYAYDVEDIKSLIKNIKDKMQNKQRTSISNKKTK